MVYRVEHTKNRNGMKDFLQLPRQIYRNDPNWVEPLQSEVRRTLDVRRNPYFANGSVDLFVCYRDGIAAARAAVIINRTHWQTFGSKAAFFGFFECINEPDAAAQLFSHLEMFCKTHGAEILEGPFNPNHYSELGIQISKFGTVPSFFQTYNPDYYPLLLEQAGFSVMKIVHTGRRENIDHYMKQRFGSGQLSYTSSEYTVRNLRMNDLRNELERIREVFNDAFADNWHFLPLRTEEYHFSAKYLSLVTKPELITIVEHNGTPVAVLECVQDINPLLKELNGSIGPLKYIRYQWKRKKIKTLIIYAVGIKKAYQRTRVYKLIFDAACRLSLDYQSLECTWTSDDNILAIRGREHLGLVRDKEFAIYKKRLT